MSKVLIEISIDNDAFTGGDCGREIARILRHLADVVNHEAAADIQDETLSDINGNKVGSFTVHLDEDEDERERLDTEFWAYVNQMSREDVVSTLENACSVQCYDHETLSQLRHALVQCLHDGDTDLESLRYFFGDKYQ